jgi:hypothetical protein
MNEYPEDFKAEFLRESEWIRAARREHGDRVIIRLVDPQSLGGMWKVLRHRIRRFPTFLVNSADRVVGWDGNPDAALARALTGRREAA